MVIIDIIKFIFVAMLAVLAFVMFFEGTANATIPSWLNAYPEIWLILFVAIFMIGLAIVIFR